MKFVKTIKKKLINYYMQFREDIFTSNKRAGVFLLLAVISSLIVGVATAYHYTEKFYANPLTWLGYLVSVFFLMAAFFPSRRSFKSWLKSLNHPRMMILVGIVLVYFLSHFWNFDTAPWNHNGLFDDASWNIYFAREYIFTDQPFQAAFWDHNISREVAFGYYISIFFKLFGYNLLVFKIALVVLGLVTLVFTALLIQRLFNNHLVTVISALVLNYLPIFFIYNFVGQRYAIAPPLIMAGLYFLYTGFYEKSPFRVIVGSFLAGILIQGSITGKQYLIAILSAVLVNMIIIFKKNIGKRNIKLGILFILGVIISSMPLIVYILFNPEYFLHEKGLTEEFINSIFSGRIIDYITRIGAVFISPHTYFRRFIPDFLPLPLTYFFLLILGSWLALIKKRFEIIMLAIIPVFGALVAGADDYRFLHAVPLWIVLIAFALNQVFKLDHKKTNQKSLIRLFPGGICLVLILSGLFSSVDYLYAKSKESDSIYHFSQVDVSRSRYLRDIVAGIDRPLTVFRNQELLKLAEPTDDFLICVHKSYAVIHTFLYDYDDRSILELCGQLPTNLFEKEQILKFNKQAISNYSPSTKDLKLIWEEAGETKEIIALFSKLSYLGSERVLSYGYNDQKFSFYSLTITNNNIEKFKQETSGFNFAAF